MKSSPFGDAFCGRFPLIYKLLRGTLCRMRPTARFIPSLLLACAALAQGSEQLALIDATVAKFPPQVDGQTEVYFVGFAGFGEERVFAEEIKLAAQRVGEKYGSTPRTLLLINDRRDLTTHPLATGVGLAHALRRIGSTMNRDEDVLFLAFSSHGWKDATIEVSNTGMPARALAADDVAMLLRESGIRWQIVVVSACFSGAFVEPLARNETIVITAASKSRSSFGCSDDRDLTYFGEAFFRDALPEAARLREAVETSRREIRRRERQERMRASHPQSYFGPLMEEKLAEIESTSGATGPCCAKRPAD
jgi:hypothetical protein